MIFDGYRCNIRVLGPRCRGRGCGLYRVFPPRHGNIQEFETPESMKGGF